MGGIITLISFAFFYMFLIALAVMPYVLQSWGLMEMLRAVGHKHPWFAWVPIVNSRAIGDLADCYDNGHPSKNLGRKLMIFTIIMFALSLAFAVLCFVLEFAIIFSPGEASLYVIMAMLGLASLIYGCVAIVIAVAYMIYYYMAMWAILRIFAPLSAVEILVLSILIPAACPFIFIVLKNKEPQNLRRPTGGSYEGESEFSHDDHYTYG